MNYALLLALLLPGLGFCEAEPAEIVSDSAPLAESGAKSISAGKVDIAFSRVVYQGSNPFYARAFHDSQRDSLFIGGTHGKEIENAYKKSVTSSEGSGKTPGADSVFEVDFRGNRLLHAEDFKLSFNLAGYHVSEPASFRLSKTLSIPGAMQAPGAKTIYVYFTVVSNKIIEACRKEGRELSYCPAYLNGREIGLVSGENGAWSMLGTPIKVGESGDGGGASKPSVLVVAGEIWLYYTSSKSALQQTIFRQKFKADGLTKIGPAERLKFENYPGESSLDQVQLVRLRCDNGTRFVTTMVASVREKNAVPFFYSEDGMKFRLTADTVVEYKGGDLAAPAQLPGPASAEDCLSFSTKHKTRREIVYSEKTGANSWELRHSDVSIQVP